MSLPDALTVAVWITTGYDAINHTLRIAADNAGALAIVAEHFEAGAWVTYGSFVFADGRPGSPSSAYEPAEDIRAAIWKATHLKCFRAELFRAIDHDDLCLPSGEWLPHARDLAIMFPLLELAGPARSVHVLRNVPVCILTRQTGGRRTTRLFLP